MSLTVKKKLWKSKMKKILCVLCALFAITGCDREQSNKPVVKIAFLYPMSGDGAIFGATAKKISDWYISEFEKNNPNAKYKYEVIFEDAQWSASKTATLANKVIAADNADAMLSMTSSQAMVMNPIAEKNKVIQLSFAADPKAAHGDFNFRIATSAKNVAERTFEYMNKNKLKTFSTVVLTSDAGSVAVIDEFKHVALENKNVKMKSAYSINPGDKNFDVMLAKIKKESPDILVVEALPPESDLFLRAMYRANVKIPVTGIWTIPALTDKSLVNGMWYVDDAAATPEFVKQFERVIGGKATNYGEFAYTMLNVLTNAWENADAESEHKPIPENVVKSIIENTEGLKTPLGTLTIDSDGGIALPGVMKQIKNGEQVIIEE